MAEKKYSLALCIVTCGRSELISDFLNNCANSYADAGIDLYFFDSSEDEATEKAVLEWPERNGLFYVRLSPETTLNEKFLRILQETDLKEKYDFLSISNDSTQHSAEALQLLMDRVDLKYDFIDLGYQETLKTREYTDPNEYLLKCVESIMHIGASWMNVHTMLTGVDWNEYESLFLLRGDTEWSGMGADVCFYLRRFLEVEHFCVLHLQITRRMRKFSALKKSAFYERDMIRYLCEGWIQTFDHVPSAYTDKWKACREAASAYTTRTVSDFLLYKRQGLYNLSAFLKYWRVWNKVTKLPRWQLFLASLLPRAWVERYYTRRAERGVRRLKAFCESFPRVMIYGAGGHGYVYGSYLTEQGIRYDGFCVSSRKPGKDTYAGYPVYELEQLDSQLKEIGFVIAMQRLNAEAVLSVLREKTDAKHIFYDPSLESNIRNKMGYQAFSEA